MKSNENYEIQWIALKLFKMNETNIQYYEKAYQQILYICPKNIKLMEKHKNQQWSEDLTNGIERRCSMNVMKCCQKAIKSVQ